MSLSHDQYYPRIMDEIIKNRLSRTGALLIEGPKWCGKTTTAEALCSSAIYLQDPDYRDYYLAQSRDQPSALLKGDYPRLIDEWQDIPRIWDAIRFDIDRSNSRGRYILTGSNTPDETAREEIKHSGAGRIARINMRTMSLYESKESTGDVSLKGLFDGCIRYDSLSSVTLKTLAFALCRGGWPSTMSMEPNESLGVARDYVDSVVYEDVSRIDGIRRNPDVVMTLMRSLARNTCTLANTTTITDDLKGMASRPTVAGYINALKDIFVVDDVSPWTPSLLSKARLRMSCKRCFSDPSIATASLGISPESLIRDMPSFGSLFESLVIRDLRVYSQVMDGSVHHYHDTTGLEVDAIITINDGRWCAIEVKLNGGVDEGARNLIRFKDKTKLADGSSPSFLAVITGTGFYHVRPDGVIVVPIGCLGP